MLKRISAAMVANMLNENNNNAEMNNNSPYYNNKKKKRRVKRVTMNKLTQILDMIAEVRSTHRVFQIVNMLPDQL